MKLFTLATLSATLEIATSHYVFVHLIVNDTVFPEWQFIRKYNPVVKNESAGDGLFGPYIDPLYNFTSPDLRCGRGAFRNGIDVETAVVLAGTQVGFQVGLPGYESDAPVEVVGHPGPGSAWLSKAENRLETYEGEGKWVKIAQVVERDPEKRKSLPAEQRALDWALYAEHSWNFTIPATTPPGQYLLRVEHLYPTLPSTSVINKGTQWYVSCTQVNIVGKGGDVFFDTKSKDFNITAYEPPAPNVWLG